MALVIRRARRLVSYGEHEPRHEKTARRAVLTSGETGESLSLVNQRIPEISPSVKRKHRFR
jgi:hypothetical protein